MVCHGNEIAAVTSRVRGGRRNGSKLRAREKWKGEKFKRLFDTGSKERQGPVWYICCVTFSFLGAYPWNFEWSKSLHSLTSARETNNKRWTLRCNSALYLLPKCQQTVIGTALLHDTFLTARIISNQGIPF